MGLTGKQWEGLADRTWWTGPLLPLLYSLYLHPEGLYPVYLGSSIQGSLYFSFTVGQAAELLDAG